MSGPAPSTSSASPASAGNTPQDGQMTRLVLELIRPYRGWLVLVFIAMLVEIAMSLAAPWPLKLVLDDALANHKLPEWLAWAHNYGIGRHTLGVALFAGLSTLLIAIIAAATLAACSDKPSSSPSSRARRRCTRPSDTHRPWCSGCRRRSRCRPWRA